LLDDPRFLAELEQIDTPLPPGSRGSDVRVSEALADPLDVDDVEWQSREPEFVCEVAPASAGSSAGRIVLAFVAFLLMMCIGGAAATVVFHDRVALILARGPISVVAASLPATGSTPR
jgi:hypothetical protein